MNPNLLERDFSYFRSLYPPLGAKILGSVIREVEKVSYPESFVFDEYPDAMTLERMSGKILAEVKDELAAAAQTPNPPAADSIVPDAAETSKNETPETNATAAFPANIIVFSGEESPSLALLVKALLFDEIMLLRQRRASIL